MPLPAAIRSASALRDLLQKPVDGASLAVLRILLGLMLAWEVVFRNNIFSLRPSDAANSFRYTYLEWLPAFPEMNFWFRGALVFCGLLLVAGLWSRAVAFIAAVLVAYGFLLVPEYYLNHIYLFWIYLFLLALVPSHHSFALRLPFGLTPQPGNVRYIHLLLLKVQTEIVLIYAGLVKINPDWLALVPLRHWLLLQGDSLFYSRLLRYDWIIATANYGVIALHLLGAPLLLFKATRLPIFIAYCIFHLINHETFEIGIFPWLMIAASTLFFDPDWPKVLLRRCGIPLTGASASYAEAAPGWKAGYTLFCLAWLVFQAIFPLRHYFYKGDVGWTYEGHRFSWRMKLVDQKSEIFWGIVHLPSKNVVILVDLSVPLGQRWQVVATRPDLTLQFAHKVATKFGAPQEDVRVHVYDLVSWNFRPPRLLIDPKANLAEKQDGIWSADWLIRQNDGTPMRYEELAKYAPAGLELPALVGAAGFAEYSRCRLPPKADSFIKFICRRPVGQ